uniref:Putative ovule protein n=1 Tax=Solanum chacoense TaxID=4108 RepID=A0A0V0I3G6_SOLCH
MVYYSRTMLLGVSTLDMGCQILGRLLSYGSSWLYAISQTCASMLIRLVQEQYIEENNFIVLEGAKGLPKSNKEWYNFKLKGEKDYLKVIKNGTALSCYRALAVYLL